MKTFITIILMVVAIIVLIIALGVVWMNMTESQSNQFASYDEAKNSQLIAKGWIPSFIPKSSYNIEEHHRVDQHYIYVSLDFSPKDISAFERACSFVTTNKYKCDHSGYPILVEISNDNHAVIRSIKNGT